MISSPQDKQLKRKSSRIQDKQFKRRENVLVKISMSSRNAIFTDNKVFL